MRNVLLPTNSSEFNCEAACDRKDMGSKASRVPSAYKMTGSLTLQRELISVVYVFIHDVVIMAGHTSDKCTAGLSVYPLFHQCFMALTKLRKIGTIFAKAFYVHNHNFCSAT